MSSDSEAQYTVYVHGSRGLTFRTVLDGAAIAEVPLGHKLINGTSVDEMIATIGRLPYSVIIINDRHEYEQQQLVELPDIPRAVAISPAQDTVAVILGAGLTCML